jgi:HD-like signal output (HDOD) protein
LTVALLSERIAERMDYPVAEAYLAGFLHDVGRIPMLIANAPEKQDFAIGLSAAESPDTESCEFGIDHCELGRRIGNSWGFSEAFVEVFGGHHGGEETNEESELVRIVSAAERFCSRQAMAGKDSSHRLQSGRNHQLLNVCLPDLGTTESMSLAEALEFEFLHAAQRLEFGASKNCSPALQG